MNAQATGHRDNTSFLQRAEPALQDQDTPMTSEQSTTKSYRDWLAESLAVLKDCQAEAVSAREAKGEIVEWQSSRWQERAEEIERLGWVD
ncbi:hypothetical protein LTR86_000779 [Recurvomyces mirabilis]|nr:hypothetical protein LTR86_000779 [Recurvomyces mirabilis]